MAKVEVKQPGFFLTISTVGSFRSPFKLKFPDSLIGLVQAELLRSGAKEYKITTKESVPEKVEVKKIEVEKQDLTEILSRLSNLESLVFKMSTKEIIIRKGEPLIRPIKEEDIEQDIFVPSIYTKGSSIDLTVKTSEKDDISDRVESLMNMKR